MNDMTFDQFKEQVASEIKDFLPEKFADARVNLQKVTKNNDTVLDAVTITSPDTNVSPTIYLNSFYKQYQEGRPMTEILQIIAELRVDHEMDQSFDIGMITDYEQVKGKITAKLVSAETNKELLSQRPHIMIDDLAVTYSVLLGESPDGSMSVPITNSLADMYGVRAEDLHREALANMEELTPTYFKGMNEVMREMMLPKMIEECDGDKEQAEAMFEASFPTTESMYVLSNEQKIYGAAALLNEKSMEQVAEKIGGEFYILPSSVHETLIVPKEMGMDVRELENMVHEVNETQVAPEERLSEHVYSYDIENHEIYRADKEEERAAAKEAAHTKNQKDETQEKSTEFKKKTSVKAKLKEKQKTVDEAKKDAPVKAPVRDKAAGLE